MTSISIHQLLPAALLAATLGSGCVAFNVGKPETFTHTDRIVETSATPIQTEIFATDARLQKSGNDATVKLAFELQESFDKREHAETITVRKQKRLAFGLFPGAAEILLMPDGALQAAVFASHGDCDEDSAGFQSLYTSDPRTGLGWYLLGEMTAVLMGGIPICLATVNSLLVEPFSDWSCYGHDFIDPQYVERWACQHGAIFWDASKSQKLWALSQFSWHERETIGINTCFYQLDKSNRPVETGDSISTHTGLIGFHKYLAVFVDGSTAGPSTVIGTETKRRSALATGPFIAEFKIPDLNHSDWKRVAPGETQATFALPAVERDCTVEAVVSFREESSVNGRGAGELTRQALEKVAGRDWRFDLALRGTGLPTSVPATVPAPAPQPVAPLFEVLEITPKGNGQYFVRVAIKDKSKTFSVLHLVKPEVYRLVREDFQSKNPGEPAQFVRERMQYETEKGGKILSFTGWVFSVRPVDNGWFYDSTSRRGWVRLRIVGGIPAAEAELWAHENIAEIVKYKNVAIESGKAPPPGATYRSLGEKFENDVLTVEFEAVQ